MNEKIEGYVFSKEERITIPALGFFLVVLSVILWIAAQFFAVMPYWIFVFFLMVVLNLELYLTVTYIKQKDYRTARYCITTNKITLKHGGSIMHFSADDEFFVCIQDLIKPLGRGYTYRPYVVLWSNNILPNTKNPYKLMIKGYIILPCTDCVLKGVLQFVNCQAIPHYPKIYHHNEMKT